MVNTIEKTHYSGKEEENWKCKGEQLRSGSEWLYQWDGVFQASAKALRQKHAYWMLCLE